jgi:hypothetical protein
MAISQSNVTGSAATVTVGAGNLQTLASSRYTADFTQRVDRAFPVAVAAVLAEDSTVPNHAARRAYAILAKANPEGYSHAALGFIIADMATNFASVDQDIADRIMAIWDLLAIAT